ncbi:SubName: Full=Uncharacterized protein {ECO:0000313/EMBL:CCA74326.1} [Serendipita indica DSM 11827]|nr:SubName: Full=Uncharacterized protein {ECO:0000313/EMBL:CCA74326.1} [Serendipita indica DSM 11827]
MQGRPAQERRGICNTKRVDTSGCYPDNRLSNQINSIRGPMNAESYVQRVAFLFSCLPSSLQILTSLATFQPLPPHHPPHHAYERTAPDSAPFVPTRRKDYKPNPRPSPPFGRRDDEKNESFHHYSTSYAAPGRRNAYMQSRGDGSPPKTLGELTALGIGSMNYLAMSAQWNTELAKLTGRQQPNLHQTTATSSEQTSTMAPPVQKTKIWAPAVMEEDVSDVKRSDILLFEDEDGRIIEQERIVFRNPWSPGQPVPPVLEEIGPLDPEPSLS